MEFNIFSQLQTELNDFFENKVEIATTKKDSNIQYLGNRQGGYLFNQHATLNTIDMYYNSKFESGATDSEGQQKIFLNICKFRVDVAAKQTDIDVKDFLFIPNEASAVWGAYFMSKEFHLWAKSNFFGELINAIVNDRPKYGSAVLKRVGSRLERVPIKTLIVQQDAKDLKTARYVIEVHEKMTLDDMREMKGWDIEGINMKFGEETEVYERHARVPLSFYKKYKKEEVEEGDDMKTIDCLAILLPQSKGSKSSEWGGNILFLEEETERPYEECHWSRQDGRWLGIGEVENNFDNQIYKNMVVNMRRRGLLWSSKKIFQSADQGELAKNLVRDVKDGEVLRVGPNGLVSQVNMNTQNLAEFQQVEQDIERNSDQKSFTYEAVTGEAMPSGTPFRLGVLLSNAVNTHFAFKREELGLFFKRVITNLVFPIFKKEVRKEHTLTFLASEEGVEMMKQVLIKYHINDAAKQQILKGVYPQLAEIELQVREEIEGRRNFFFKIGEGFYDYLKTSVDLVITGEQVDLPKKIETLTNTYNTMVQKQDPNAQKVLARILSLTGENYDLLSGSIGNAPQAQIPTNLSPQQAMPNAQAPVPDISL